MMVLIWLIGAATWFVVIGGIMMKSEMLWWYHLSHVVAGISAVVMGILMPLMWLAISANPSAATDALVTQAKQNGGIPSTVRRIGWVAITWSVFVSTFFFILYLSQGWVVIAGFHLVAAVSWWGTIPHWNKCVDELKRRV